jgi:MFS family permease
VTEPHLRATRTIFVVVALGSAALYAAFTAAPLIATEMTGRRSLSGIPGASILLGAAIGSWMLSTVMARRGRRAGLRLGYSFGLAGSVVALTAIIGDGFLPFLAGMLMIGIGHSANLLSRFAVADMHKGPKRPSVLGWIVWAGTIGAALGPSLLRAGEPIADTLGVSSLAGAFLFALVLAIGALAFALWLDPDPSSIAVDDTAGAVADAGSRLPMLWRLRHIRLALIVMVIGQLAMILIMTITPVHIREHGHGLGVVGGVMTSHFVGMFAFAPLIGKFVARRGSSVAILIGLPVLIAGAIAGAAAPASSGILLGASLFLVGLGWSFGFVAGSALLTHGLSYKTRVSVQGTVDGLVWLASTIASLSSGILLAALGFWVLCVIGAAVVVWPLLLVGIRRREPFVEGVTTA